MGRYSRLKDGSLTDLLVGVLAGQTLLHAGHDNLGSVSINNQVMAGSRGAYVLTR